MLTPAISSLPPVIACDGRCKRPATHRLKILVFGRLEPRHYCYFCFSIVKPQVERAEQQAILVKDSPCLPIGSATLTA